MEEKIEILKERILNETTSHCNECPNKERCPEEECVLFRIEQIVEEKEFRNGKLGN